MDLEFPKDHPLYGRRFLNLYSDEALLESYKYEDMVDAKFDLALFEELRAAKLEKDEQNLCLDSEQASEVKKPERKKPNSKEPTAKRAKVGKGKNVNESNAENEEATGEKRRSLTEEEKNHSLVRVFERRPEYANAMEWYAAAAAEEAAVKWMSLIEEAKYHSLVRVFERRPEYTKAMELYAAAAAASAAAAAKEAAEKRRSLTEEEKNHSLVRVFERRPECANAMEWYAAAAAAEEAAVKWMSLIEEEKKAMHLYNAATAENEDQEGYDKEDKEGQSDDKEAPAPGEVEELTDEE